MTVRHARIALAIAIAGLALPSTARADAIFNVTLDTGLLSVAPGSSSGPFGMYFQLTDGSGTGNGNNVVTLSGFDLGAGAFLPATIATEGGIGGDVTASVTLTDTSFFNFMFQGFTPGALLSFVVSMTTNTNGDGLPPDAFAFSILDGLGAPIPTLDPTSADTLFTIAIDSATPQVSTYGTDQSRTSVVLSSPQVSVPAAVPEPSTLLLTGAGLGLASLVPRQRRRAKG